MTGWAQGWLVARREMRERSRSHGFRVSLVLMVAAVVALLALPSVFGSKDSTKAVGVSGATSQTFARVLNARGDAADTAVTLRRFQDVPSAEQALRDDRIDVLVVGARRLEWRDRADPSLQGLVTTAIQVSVVHQRAAAVGVDPDTAAVLLAPIPVTNAVIGAVAGRDAEDSAAAALMTVALVMAIVVYGNLVLTGVVEEKSSRVVEVLLARVPAKALLGGKVVGIGILGFCQFAITAVAALVTMMAMDSADLPAVTGGVLAWVVAWFLLGYALYAMIYGALGSLASRTEDAQSVAGPVSYVMIAGYWASFIAIGEDPDGAWARVLSLFPATAPLAMPGRIALGATEVWEPWLAAALTLAAIAGLVSFAGRVYGNAILHSGSTMKLRDAWHRPTDAEHETPTTVEKVTQMAIHPRTPVVWTVLVSMLGSLAAASTFVLTQDVIWSLIPLLLTIGIVREVLRRGDKHSRHHTPR